MSNTKNAGVAGGVVLLMLWGGIGFFFGKGKGKGDNEKQGSKANIEQRAEPRRNPVREPQAPRTVTPAPPPRVGTVKAGTPTARETFTYVLRLTFIHPLSADGKVSETTISEEELIAKGKLAKAAKKELHLKIKGDARAKWLNRLKHKLKQQDVAYSISNDY